MKKWIRCFLLTTVFLALMMPVVTNGDEATCAKLVAAYPESFEKGCVPWEQVGCMADKIEPHPSECFFRCSSQGYYIDEFCRRQAN